MGTALYFVRPGPDQRAVWQRLAPQPATGWGAKSHHGPSRPPAPATNPRTLSPSPGQAHPGPGTTPATPGTRHARQRAGTLNSGHVVLRA
jgi:hypothetical protein